MALTKANSRMLDDGVFNVKDYGADNTYHPSTNPSAGDSTAAFQAAIDAAMVIGGTVLIPAGGYKITDTLDLNTGFTYGFAIRGTNVESTRVYFKNSTSLKPLLSFGGQARYIELSDINFLDENVRVSRCLYFQDTYNNASSPATPPAPDDGKPNWKHNIKNVRIDTFKEGARFDGYLDGGTTNWKGDAHCSEVMFLHCKFKNNETGIIYNNIQAVNHHLIAVDLENDDITTVGDNDSIGLWTHIKFERGSYVSHVGGSVIGWGSYIDFTYPSSPSFFQATHQFTCQNIRIEKRGGLTQPVFNHNTNSSIANSQFFRVVATDCAVTVSDFGDGYAEVLGRFGGRMFASFERIRVAGPSTHTMAVEAYATQNLNNNEFGSIEIKDCINVEYEAKTGTLVTGYGASGQNNNYKVIPANISKINEGNPFTVSPSGSKGNFTGGEYMGVVAAKSTEYVGKAQYSEIKTFVFATYTSSGNGAGDPYEFNFQLPKGARPFKFRILQDNPVSAAAMTFTLDYVVGANTDTVATLTTDGTTYGHDEANIKLPAVKTTGITRHLVDGTTWDGKVNVTKSGTATAFHGMILIDYM